MNFSNHKYRINSPLTFLSLACLLNFAGGLLTTNSAQAFTLDFNNPAVIEADGTRTINTGVNLAPATLDGAGQSIDLGDGNGLTTFSTTSGVGGNVGDLFSPIGIDISVPGSSPDGTGENADGVGLFNSLCDSAGNEACEVGGNGDPDLATGGAFNTTPQGNLLIIEENAGDGVPDDFFLDGTPGNLRLEFDQGGILSNVLLESITFVDDTEANITVNFVGGSNQTASINLGDGTASGSGITLTSDNIASGNNAVGTLSGFTQSNVESIDIEFETSGGVGALVFSEFTGTNVVVPFEFSSGLGLLLSGLGFLGLKISKHRKLATKLKL